MSGTCFGYTGNFATPTKYPTFTYVEWQYGSDNCFGISPDRRIWSTSPGYPWSVIPGSGLADGVSDLGQTGDSSSWSKTVQVWVASTGHYYCQTYWLGTGWEGYWTRCDGGVTPN